MESQEQANAQPSDGKKPFSWSQVVRDDPKEKSGISRTASESAIASVPSQENIKLSTGADSAMEIPAHAVVGNASSGSADCVPKEFGEKDTGLVQEGRNEGGSSQEGAEVSPKARPSVVDAPQPLKPAWGSAATTSEGSFAEKPADTAVLSETPTAWPTLGDSRTEPQKRGGTTTYSAPEGVDPSSGFNQQPAGMNPSQGGNGSGGR
eukprot:CAMPEP_0198241794 /NCGR_PEP_ID=MMETSP1446-20131203/6497_1 /TAXON_ID=1461542 ORGANISM="Unidentified sp, Strain CCMP2111" /NCGR_SAMPLE_ID=MMETSP1446 /ASSEMBLY_ACC=CAM_ASM_001112 /LENGTH=206 /DNA_ID=CAMNT_0043924671 /DNA_START=348 /DNA_END=964 /DNA_ORIENTATION=+